MFRVKAWTWASLALFFLPAVSLAQAPAITSPNRAEFVAGQVGAFTVTATGTPPPTLSQTGVLPAGLNFIPATGILTGKPTTTGSYRITFTASNGVMPNAVQGLDLMVDGPAVITSANKATFISGQAGTFTVTAAGFPAPTLTETAPLPAGVTFVPASGALNSTTATPAGSYSISFIARNGVGEDSVQPFTLTVAPTEAPKITSPSTASFPVGLPDGFQVTTSGTPAPMLSVNGALPMGVTFTPGTGVLSSTAQTPAGKYTLTFTARNGIGVDATQSFTLSVGRMGGEIVRAVMGFEQIGASATASSQSFMFDFYISRPIRLLKQDGDPIWGPRLRWWANVKVSSFPYTQKSSLATFAPQFATAFGNQNLNQLAESLEFVTGPEYRLLASGSYRSLTDPSSAARFGLTWFAGFGATGPNNPTDNATVFQQPFAGSTQAALLNSLFPLPNNATYPTCPLPATPPTPCTNYVAFVPTSGDRFLQQWGTGLRLYSVYTNKDSGDVSFTAPATGEVSFGENAAITQGHLNGPVFHAAAMYPFPIGDRATSPIIVFLFGSVDTALRKNTFEKTLTLVPAFDSSGNPISISAAGVTQISVDPNRRDTYRIGAGIDLVTVWNKLMPPKSTAVKP